jgi:transcriptional regulator with XRE-family HTH domain
MAALAFGSELKDWRGRRRVSQLDLGLAADVSARHVSFLETGRATPSRAMVLRLAEALEVPRSERNGLLRAAGFAPLYPAHGVGDAAVAPLAQAVDWLLDRHAPYPGFAIDRHWNLKRANAPAAAMLAGVGLDLARGANLVDAFLDVAVLRDAVVNLGEVLDMTMSRLKTENAELGGDAVLAGYIARLEADPARRSFADDTGALLPAVIAAKYRLGGRIMSVFSTIAQFGTAHDIGFADLRIELLFPADAETAAAFKGTPVPG